RLFDFISISVLSGYEAALGLLFYVILFFFFSSRRRHTRSKRDWSSDVCSSDLGKTTTIRSIMNLIPIDKGSIHLFGQSLEGKNQTIKRRMGMVPQEIVIFEDLSVRENLHFFGKMYGLSGGNLNRRIDEELNFIGLSDRQNMRPKAFCGGMKRRLNIGCAIVQI